MARIGAAKTAVIALMTLLTFVVMYKAVCVPITYDEANTCPFGPGGGFIHLILARGFGPNVHILNSLCMRLAMAVLPIRPWALRLPNVVMFLLYAACVYKIAERYFKGNAILFVLPAALLLCNPYLLDFFSLARGYGMGSALMLCSVYALLRFAGQRNLKWYYLCMATAMLAAYANFTFLIYWAAAQLLLLAMLLINRNSGLKKVIAVTGAALLVFAILCYLPMRSVYGNILAEFGPGGGFYEDTVLSLMDKFLYGNTHNILSSAGLESFIHIVLIASSITFILNILRNPTELLSRPFNVIAVLMILVTIINLAELRLMHTAPLSGRTALMYYILFALLTSFLARELWGLWPRATTMATLPVIFYMAFSFSTAVNLTSVYEWGFNAHTCDALDYIENYRKQHNKTGTTTSLFVNGNYYSSFNFYKQSGQCPWLDLESKPQGADTLTQALFYFAAGEDTPVLLNNYSPVKQYTVTGVNPNSSPMQVLMLRK